MINQEKLDEMRQDMLIEQKMRVDFEYALDKLGFSEDNSVAELSRILKQLRSLGWDVTADELLESYNNLKD